MSKKKTMVVQRNCEIKALSEVYEALNGACLGWRAR